MKRGPYKQGRKDLYIRARKLRHTGLGYRLIGKRIGINWHTIRNWVRDITLPKGVAQRAANDLLFKPLNQLKRKQSVRNFLIRLRGYRCEKCKRSKWQGKKIPLETHHKNGKNKDNRGKNLQLLCCNCHAQTPGWRRKSSGTRRGT